MERLKARAIEPSGVDGDVLVTLGGEAVWGDSPAPALPLNDLIDVDTTGLSDGDLLRWDAAIGQWVAYTQPPSTALVPATTVTSAGEPVLLWNDANELVLVEVTP